MTEPELLGNLGLRDAVDRQLQDAGLSRGDGSLLDVAAHAGELLLDVHRIVGGSARRVGIGVFARARVVLAARRSTSKVVERDVAGDFADQALALPQARGAAGRRERLGEHDLPKIPDVAQGHAAPPENALDGRVDLRGPEVLGVRSHRLDVHNGSLPRLTAQPRRLYLRGCAADIVDPRVDTRQRSVYLGITRPWSR
jgi:hypothetical protein